MTKQRVVILRVLPKNPLLRKRDPCAAAKALATRGREYPQDDREGIIRMTNWEFYT